MINFHKKKKMKKSGNKEEVISKEQNFRNSIKEQAKKTDIDAIMMYNDGGKKTKWRAIAPERKKSQRPTEGR